MESSVLKTIVYADIFDYPLTDHDTHRFLIGKKAEFFEVKKTLKTLYDTKKIEFSEGLYFLPSRKEIVFKRQLRNKLFLAKIKTAKIAARILQVLPQIKLIGVSGGLAVANADASDDIDFFIITSENQLWTTRLLSTALLSFSGLRRTPKSKSLADKICLNMFIDERLLEIRPHDLYLAHEVLQMMPLFERDNTYQKFIKVNSWAYQFLPNWPKVRSLKARRILPKIKLPFSQIPLSYFEDFSKKFQLNYMAKRRTIEKISPTKLQFHPKDVHAKILNTFIEQSETLNLD